MREGRSFTLRGRAPTPHYANTPWLKAAYLSVFSLLGAYGYRYAEGEAIKHVREQIMNPGDEILPRFITETPAEWQDQRDAIILSRSTCWAVKMGKVLVPLPRSWDRTFYDNIIEDSGGTFSLRGDHAWFPAKFGRNRATSLTPPDGADPVKVCDGDIFGCRGEVVRDGVSVSFVLVDRRGRELTAVVTGYEKVPASSH